MSEPEGGGSVAKAAGISHPFEVTHRSVLAIALPMTIAFMSTPILGLVDTAVVGQLGDAALLGGLAVGAILFDIVFTTFNFLRSATTGLVAQAVGARNDQEQQLVCLRSLLIAALSGFFILLAAPAILWIGLWFMDAPSAVSRATADYFVIRVLAAPFSLINYAFLGWLLGLGRAMAGLGLQLVLNGTNIAFSLLLGLYIGWGLVGIAYATVIAEAVAALSGAALYMAAYRGRLSIHWPDLVNPQALRRLFAVNRDIMIRSFVLLFAFAFFTAQGAQFGEVTLAANAVLMNFFFVAGYLLDGLATAAEQLAGRAIGARYRPAFDRSVSLSLFWGTGIAALATLLFWFAGPSLIDVLTSNPQVRAEANTYLIWAALTAIAGVAAFQMDGVYIGATWSQDMRNMMLLSLAAYLLVWWLTTPHLGNHGLWLALEVFLAIRGATLLARLPYRRRLAFAPS